MERRHTRVSSTPLACRLVGVGCPSHSCWRCLLQCTPKCGSNFNTQWDKLQKPPRTHDKGNYFFPVNDENHCLRHATTTALHKWSGFESCKTDVHDCLYQNFDILLFMQAKQSLMSERNAMELRTCRLHGAAFVSNSGTHP